VVDTYNVVVVSHSCDLEQGKLENIIVCPHFSLAEMEESAPHLKQKGMKDKLRRGTEPSYHMLAACDLEGKRREIRVVDFRNIFSLPLASAQEVARTNGQRLRLRSPYLEHFSQAFARLFMRVALPTEIPPQR
jgi:hypothetical protein